MKLIYLNAELDITKEHELKQITPLGFKVEITYKDTFFCDNPEIKEEILKYQTEIHHLPVNPFNSKDIAFESDIISEGFTRNIKYIETVIISLMEA
jgi:hypothetical protein